MGNRQSSVRSTHFQPTNMAAGPYEDEVDDHHINISNKMVERLVEDGGLDRGKSTASVVSPRCDLKEKILIEKLKCLDKSHTERLGLTVGEVKALTKRVEMRTSNMVSTEAVCAACKDRVIACYDSAADPAGVVRCWETVGAFTQCVQEEAAQRLRARTERDDRERIRRSRDVALAREHALRELSGPYGDHE
ncbi:uncharacterized protein LOC126970757 isoform X3 [Leptidea sinapis]|uniref:Uncharacterized protein n=2 Tax=Leptidea sinapis TaxID=189913 RepID=A0A5E4PW21_9NEOP|nr:uncharacterized protein LOC126970757 isoform X3 [Leptidea sinapis]XP_050672809.1 uncharacterized protein LOC126970757 isoform X3 [Leptidea sinapis]XP_050672819.1 uncharacterized protein LOC126970757 isoform X3 [Leptidea sinapis]XP_050672830.1 uncharacterized protein LOC126970757 isoform X3 [Leptidea sinapis]XP_050672839.1 uncharacterized protein LOC126970757 isoform X3 [Leptidea sinapis]XP_050672849.1 uncharacterized protein LOC126970757 isoform X3 [Leptidea sinapis]XP_050672858.1 uncharac